MKYLDRLYCQREQLKAAAAGQGEGWFKPAGLKPDEADRRKAIAAKALRDTNRLIAAFRKLKDTPRPAAKRRRTWKRESPHDAAATWHVERRCNTVT